MPSPSENRAVDLILAAFPGSEIVSVDRTRPIPKPDIPVQYEPVMPVVTKPPPPSVKRRYQKGSKKPGKNQEGMFGAEN